VQIQSTGIVFFSSDATHLVGGGTTIQAYNGGSGPVELHPLNGGGVLTVQASSHAAFISSNYQNLLGGGSTQQAYTGGEGALSYISLIKLQRSDLQSTTTTVTSEMDGKPAALQIEDVIPGTGAQVTSNNIVSVNYTGWLDDGTEFDSNMIGKGPNPQPFKSTDATGRNPAPLGSAALIQGWRAGLVGMKVGGVRKLVIPASLAYGTKGQGTIPANATLTFEIEMVSIS
jgi:peptidylprolyl isomerase/FKBP-type peptidyl-prolyl cis-trans isomerase FkpA